MAEEEESEKPVCVCMRTSDSGGGVQGRAGRGAYRDTHSKVRFDAVRQRLSEQHFTLIHTKLRTTHHKR